MNTVICVALVTGDGQTGYQAEFPDFPECRAEGAQLGELLVNARKVLGEKLSAMADADEAWPVPPVLEAFQTRPGVTAVLVDVAVDDAPVRVNISIGERLLKRLDAAAEIRGMTRSGLIAQAVRVSLGERPQGETEYETVSRGLREELSALGRGLNEVIGPESPFGRRMADLDERLFEGVRKAADGVSSAMTRRQEANRAKQTAPPVDAP